MFEETTMVVVDSLRPSLKHVKAKDVELNHAMATRPKMERPTAIVMASELAGYK